jgi:sugar diacid utilization regulator
MHRLGLGDEPVIVMALAVIKDERSESPNSLDPALTSETQQLNNAFAMHLSTVHPRASSALIGDIAYGLLPTRLDREHAASVERIAADFLDRLGDRVRAVVGIGPVAHDVSGIAAARMGADRALRVAREGGRNVRVARLSDVQVDALLLELRDAIAARGDEPSGPIARLIAHDATHGGSLVETLRAWLDSFGDVNAASALMFVHPSTFRYRLRRLAEIGDLDLGDPDARFVAMLQLRVLWPRSPQREPPRA